MGLKAGNAQGGREGKKRDPIASFVTEKGNSLLPEEETTEGNEIQELQ